MIYDATISPSVTVYFDATRTQSLPVVKPNVLYRGSECRARRAQAWSRPNQEKRCGLCLVDR